VLADGDAGDMLSRQERAYALGIAEFREHLEIILASGWKMAQIGAVSSLGGDPQSTAGERGIALTFDDSWPQHARVAAPALLARGLSAVFFLTSGELGRLHRLSENEVRQLSQLGFGIGSHGASHRFFTALNDDDLRAELSDSRKRLEDCIGQPVRWLSLPGGRGNRRVARFAAEAGYEAIFGSRPGLWRADPEQPQQPARAMEIIPRICLRPGQKGKALLCDLLKCPEAAVKRLARGDRLRRLARFLLGDRLYHTLHRIFL
ncbi:MAG: polysaccharide deacetylase family protein, partial [Planctomycetota bacterium]|nr:polysaccharide deacetylase family protein [Planctomycetota bacterium]